MAKSAKKWDFSGWATKAGIKCSDGRTILPNAFSGNDGKEVPLVWNHQHNDPSEVLGHALLENRPEGVYAYCSFNNNPKGREAKELVKHGDVTALSIYANQLVQTSKIPPCDVIHGSIREVSLVLAGANVGAYIDNVMMHGETVDTEAEIYHGDFDEDLVYYEYPDDIYHADEEDDKDEDEKMIKNNSDKSVSDVLNTLNDEQKAAVGILLEEVTGGMQHSAMYHADDEDEDDDEDDDDGSGETVQDVFNTFTEKQKKAVYAVIGLATSGAKTGRAGAMRHADMDDDDDGTGETIEDVFDTLSEKQKKAAYAIIGAVLEKNNGGSVKHAATDDDDEDDEDFDEEDIDEEDIDDEDDDDIDEDEEKNMKHNVFDTYDNEQIVSREDQAAIIMHAYETKSKLKNVIMEECRAGGVLAHAITDHNGSSVTYGIANIDYLFPDARAINNTPEMVMHNQTWVDKVMNGTHHTPFARVKSLYADLTGEDARARGYVKGNKKVEEVIEVLQREVNPQTITKLQKLDRDDVIDITDFDVVAWLKAEMQIMLKAEIARAILISDGRALGTDKIKETCIVPIASDNDVFTIKVPVSVTSDAKSDDISDAIIDAVIKSRKNYKGSGNPSFFINEDYLSGLLLLKDGMGRRIYETEASLAAALRVKELIPVDVMENASIKISNVDKPLIGVIVNLQDYNVGTNKGGATQFFDDFDIDFNQMKYLYETRLSGALVKPYSAMSVYLDQA